MKKIALVAGLVLAASVAVAPLAFAQDDDAPSCAEALVALNTAQANLDAAETADKAAAEAAEHDEAAAAARAAVKGALKAPVSGNLVNDPGGEPAITAADVQVEIDRLENKSGLTVAEQRELEADRVLVALVKARDTAGEAEAETNAAALKVEADKTDAAKLAEALATAKAVADGACRGPQGEPGFVDLDCRDFPLPLPDGRTAQQVLDATPGQDPHRLDLDDDRVACEIDEPIDDGNDSDTGGDFDQVGELPTAIDTGRA